MTTGATPQDATHVHDTEEGRIYYRCLPPQAPGAGVTKHERKPLPLGMG